VADTANWEFAAAVAAVTMGLGGVLLFTLIGTIGSWRVYRLASQSANEAIRANIAMQDLARHLASRPLAAPPALDLQHATDELADLRRQADALFDQQSRLQEAVRNLVEARVLGSNGGEKHLEDLEAAVRRLEDNLGRVAAAVANLTQRQP
jgi:hypothetical protein